METAPSLEQASAKRNIGAAGWACASEIAGKALP
jgi:hypothetical protein